MSAGPRKPLARSLGEFVGILWRAARTPVEGGGGRGSRVVKTEVRERVVETPGGPVTLRRTTIDEVEPGVGSGGGV
ncbi:MAG: hypothetical protein HRU70_05240 [Phycisphaeraceae bacterium]|nr:MAG: hypothetical protein HRU70_05240 [Phycisphaeraceae bacterium]